jgi:sulfite exporter TauE/SafE
MIDYGVVFMTGLLASLHCAGMCGALVLGYSTRMSVGVERGSWLTRGMLMHLAYNAGRILAYAAVGALLSALALKLMWVKNAGSYVSIAAGVVMVVAGVAMLGLIRLPSRISLGSAAPLAWHAKLLRGSTPAHTLGLGLLTPLLPCGMLYGMLALAAASPSVIEGATTMAVFALGMSPVLIALGSVSSFFSARVRKGAEYLAAVSIVLMGVVLILRGFHIPFLGLFETPGQSCCTPAN